MRTSASKGSALSGGAARGVHTSASAQKARQSRQVRAGQSPRRGADMNAVTRSRTHRVNPRTHGRTGRGRERLLWVGGMVGGLALFLGVLLYVASRSIFPEPAPNSADIATLARKWVDDNVDALGEDVARFLLGENWLLTELGGEFIEDRIHDVVNWHFVVTWPTPFGDGRHYEAIATAHVIFTVDAPLLGISPSYRFTAILVDH